MARNISISASDASLDGVVVRYRRGQNDLPPPAPDLVAFVDATFTLPGIGGETVSRKVSDIPAAVFSGAGGATPKALHMDQVRRLLSWLRGEVNLNP